MAEDNQNTVTAEQKESAQVLDDLTSLSHANTAESGPGDAIEHAGRIDASDHSDKANLQPDFVKFEAPPREEEVHQVGLRGVGVVEDQASPLPTVPPIDNPNGGAEDPVPPPPTHVPEYEPIQFPVSGAPEGQPVAPERVEPTTLPGNQPDVGIPVADAAVRETPAVTAPPVTNPPTPEPTAAPTPEPTVVPISEPTAAPTPEPT
ncbi:MAG: hypothetical protein HQL77_14660, partial [Magnetococcales bacterium]|nr:hypothetical protein [Magnetococcales bacterium]